MPEFFNLLFRSLFEGIAIGWSVLALFIFTNTGGLGDVIWNSSDQILAIVLLSFGFAITFGSTSVGIAIMAIPNSDIVFSDDNVENPDYEFPY